jgi:hypothetical protein
VLRALVLDFNGVLVHDEPLHLELSQRVLREEEIELTPGITTAGTSASTIGAAFTAVLAQAGRPDVSGLIARLIARKAEYYRQAVRRDGYPISPGAVELVREAAALLPVALVSGALRDEVVGALRQAGIEGAFKRLVTAEDVERGKPDRRVRRSPSRRSTASRRCRRGSSTRTSAWRSKTVRRGSKRRPRRGCGRSVSRRSTTPMRWGRPIWWSGRWRGYFGEAKYVVGEAV